MPTAVFSPTVATLPASSTAWPSGSVASLRACGAGGAERGRELRAAGAVRFGVVRVLRFELALDAVVRGLRAAEPLLRLALRWPGRDRGRLPRTPGSSSRSGATDEKIAVGAARTRARCAKALVRPRGSVNVGTTEARPSLDGDETDYQLGFRGIPLRRFGGAHT
jgi:hypothetical protein